MDQSEFLVLIAAIFVVYVNCGGERQMHSFQCGDRERETDNFEFSLVVPPPAEVSADEVDAVKYHEQEKCGFNRRFTFCGNLCNTTCKTMGPFCGTECSEGCLCNEGYGVFSMLDICVPIVSPLCKFERHRYWMEENPFNESNPSSATFYHVILLFIRVEILTNTQLKTMNSVIYFNDIFITSFATRI